MKSIKIINPKPGGSRYMALSNAEYFVRRGLAKMEAGMLRFFEISQAEREAEANFREIRKGILYWNGARSHYDAFDRDVAMFPPCCNVVFPKAHSPRAIQRFCR